MQVGMSEPSLSNADSSSSSHSSPDCPTASPDSSVKLFSLGFLAILLGAFSLCSLLGPTWWICGGVGFLGCTLIMIHFNRFHLPFIIRLLAIGGLCASLLTISYTPTQYYLRRMAIIQQAELFGNAWIKNILSGKPERALSALTEPGIRLSKRQLANYYQNTSKGQTELRQFESKRLVKCLLALNGSARSAIFQTENVRTQGKDQIITSLFTVSYLETPLEKKTFFVRLVIKRNDARRAGEWSILRYYGGVRPRSGAFAK